MLSTSNGPTGQGPGTSSSKKRTFEDNGTDEGSPQKTARVDDVAMTVDDDIGTTQTNTLDQYSMLEPCPHLVELSLSEPDAWVESAKRMVTVIAQCLSALTVIDPTSESPNQLPERIAQGSRVKKEISAHIRAEILDNPDIFDQSELQSLNQSTHELTASTDRSLQAS
jgi:hypothetical protein